MTNSQNFNKNNFFFDEEFENELRTKLKQIDFENTVELVNRANFLSKLKEIFIKFPFLYLPNFVTDFISGIDKTNLYSRYSIQDKWDRTELIEKILLFNGRHYRVKKFKNAKELNLTNYRWCEKFEDIMDNCKFFSYEIEKKLFQNILRSYIIYRIIDYIDKGISIPEIKLISNSLKNDYVLCSTVDKTLEKKFEKFFNGGFEKLVEKIIDQLIDSNILEKKSENPNLFVGRLSFEKIKNQIINELKIANEGYSDVRLRNKISEYFPSLQLLPDDRIFKTILDDLKKDKIIRINTLSNWRDSGIIFLNDDYQRIQQKLIRLDEYDLEFHGRTISPENFITELLELDKGDFADKDDQVTRIAGLVLAESVKIQAPHERIPEFDFITDITNYRFRDDQKNAMRKLDFHIKSNIFHCKVMLDEVLDLQEFQKLKNSLPENEQGIVITFEKIPENVGQILETDKTIQVIDEDALKVWVGITSKIPARKNSTAKLYYDPLTKLERKIVKINLIDYENGYASVLILPEMNEATVLVRALEEIPLNESSPGDFEKFSNNYLEFLTMISEISIMDDFITGLFDTKIIKSNIKNSSEANFTFEHHHVDLYLDGNDKRQIVMCNCMKYIENSLYLCPHVVVSLDCMFRTFSSINQSWNSNDNQIQHALEKILNQNITIILDKLDIALENGKIKYNPLMSDFISGLSQIKENE